MNERSDRLNERSDRLNERSDRVNERSDRVNERKVAANNARATGEILREEFLLVSLGVPRAGSPNWSAKPRASMYGYLYDLAVPDADVVCQDQIARRQLRLVVRPVVATAHDRRTVVLAGPQSPRS